MKKVLFIIVLLIANINLSAQSLSVFDVDPSNFPIMKAMFYAFDNAGKQIKDFNPSDFKVTENGADRNVRSVSCPNSVPVAVSSVLVFDVSSSMSAGPPRILSAKNAANAWLDGLPNAESECALVSFDDNSMILQDFTKDRTKIKNSISKLSPNGGTDYDQALIDLPCGGLQIAKNGKHKRVLIFLTDGQGSEPKTNEIINFANQNNIVIYAVTLDMPAPQCIKDMTKQTGGQYFENITTIEEAEIAYQKLLQLATNIVPCEIEWESETTCTSSFINLEIKLIPHNISNNIKYTPPASSIAKLEFLPTFIFFKDPPLEEKVEKKITVTAINADFVVSNIILSNEHYSINPNNFTLQNGESIELTAAYTAVEKGYTFCKLDFQTNICQVFHYVSGGYIGVPPLQQSLKVTKPVNGDLYVVGSDTIITWEGIAPSDAVSLEYSNDNGNTWNLITENASGLKYNWNNIPKPPSSNGKIKARKGAKEDGILLLDLQCPFLSHPENICWNPQGTKVALATSYSDTTCVIWDVINGQKSQTLIGHSFCVTYVDWSPDGNRVATASADNTSIIWDAATGIKLISLLGHQDYINHICWSPDGSKVATASADNTSIIWDVSSGAILQVLKGHSKSVWYIAWSPDGNRVATASADNTSIIWDANTGNKLFSLEGNSSEIKHLSWSPDANKIAISGNCNDIGIWDSNSGQKIITLIGHTNYVNFISWSPDGNRVATASFDNTSIIWDANTGYIIHKLVGHNEYVFNVNWNIDGSRVATSSNDWSAIVWDAYNGKKLFILSKHKQVVRNLSWSPDCSKIATSSWDKTVKIWDLGEDIIQEAESEVFSIVEPLAKAQDIDMKQCLLGVSKDSVVTDFISNTGGWKIRIDDIYFEGADKDAFSLVSGLPVYEIGVGASKHAEFRFTPNRVGEHNAEIVIITQADTLYKTIRGEGVLPVLGIVNNLIDFGKVFVGEFRDTLSAVTIKNIGTSPLTINSTKHNFPNDVDFTTQAGGGSFTLNAGEEHKMDLRFTPSDEGRTSGTLEFHFSGSGSPAVILLYAEGIKRKPIINTEPITFNEIMCENTTSAPLKIANTGTLDLEITDIQIIGTDKDNFQISATYPIIIKPETDTTLSVSFISSLIGNKTAQLEIYSNSDEDNVLTLDLNGTKKSAIYSISSQEINFGEIQFGEMPERNFDIVNQGTQINKYLLTAPLNMQLSENSFYLNPNQPKTITVKYVGTLSGSDISGSIIIKDTNCNVQNNIQLQGNSANIGAALKAGDISAAPGEEVQLPIEITNLAGLKQLGVTSINTELIFNRTILFPLDYQTESITASEGKIKIVNLSEDVNYVKFVAALGNAASCELKLQNPELVGGTSDILIENGNFKLLGICEDGGQRLINTEGEVIIKKISPNPSDGNINIEINLIESGKSVVSIVNEKGEIIETRELINSKGINTISLNARKYCSGLYFINLETPTLSIREKFVVVK